ncbi:membrane protein [Microtetraspora sp. NBRC 13810]|uniref:YcnI family copper-binding membrane protein n=1 Tax=Microtetraspora sp. NBRC 13810 TaxID=3030990 RepID=UPI0024A10FB7|nr:YcnI family protein [Microtetraspora sp. NBRC 13810]GLW09317.1 membrane protein [Microtetraspora sp. NBRC 13810]
MSLSSVCAVAGRRVLAVTAAVTALTLGLALPALAHVTINPNSVEQGSFSKVAFRVPNERDDARTTKLEVEFPTDHPLPFVSVRPVDGWKIDVHEGKLPKPVNGEYGEITEAVTRITWSGGEIDPGQFQEFEVSIGGVPKDTDQLIFPTTQTYSNGEVVKWADEPKADGSEPERPAPVLKLVPPSGDGGHGAAAPAAAPSGAAAPSVTPVAAASSSAAAASDTTARVLAAAGILVGLIGTVVGVLGFRRSRA